MIVSHPSGPRLGRQYAPYISAQGVSDVCDGYERGAVEVCESIDLVSLAEEFAPFRGRLAKLFCLDIPVSQVTIT